MPRIDQQAWWLSRHTPCERALGMLHSIARKNLQGEQAVSNASKSFLQKQLKNLKSKIPFCFMHRMPEPGGNLKAEESLSSKDCT